MGFLHAPIFAQLTFINEGGGYIETASCDEYVNSMNRGWYIDIPGNSRVYLSYYIDIEEGYDNVTIYSINDKNVAELQTTLTGAASGVIQALYPNGKIYILFATDSSVNCEDGYSGIYFDIYTESKINFAYDAAGNRTSRTILLENSNTLRSAMSDGEQEESVYEDKIEYSADSEMQAADVLIYPNPTQGQLAVEIRNLKEGVSGDIYLMKDNGQLIEKKGVIAGQKTDFDLTNEAPGVYLINIRIGKTVTSWKVIKK